MTEPETPDEQLRRLARSRGRRAEQRAEIKRRLAGIADPPPVRLRPLNQEKKK
jgi:hypothetical protein